MTKTFVPPLKGSYAVPDEKVKFYNQNGFVLLEQVLTPAEAAQYVSVIDEAVETRTGSDKRTLAEKSPYEREFLQCGHLWSEFPLIRELTLSPRLGGIAVRLLNAEHVRLWHDQALYKVPGGDATEPHQDLAYWPMLDRNAGTIWLALEDVTVDMGAMFFVPGSHNAGIDSFEHRIEDAIEGKSRLLENVTKQLGNEPVGYNLKAGDATFHHGLTVHYTKKNVTDKVRKGMTVIYFADGVRYNAHSPASGHPCAGQAEHGEPINSDKTPIII